MTVRKDQLAQCLTLLHEVLFLGNVGIRHGDFSGSLLSQYWPLNYASLEQGSRNFVENHVEYVLDESVF